MCNIQERVTCIRGTNSRIWHILFILFPSVARLVFVIVVMMLLYLSTQEREINSDRLRRGSSSNREQSTEQFTRAWKFTGILFVVLSPVIAASVATSHDFFSFEF